MYLIIKYYLLLFERKRKNLDNWFAFNNFYTQIMSGVGIFVCVQYNIYLKINFIIIGVVYNLLQSLISYYIPIGNCYIMIYVETGN